MSKVAEYKKNLEQARKKVKNNSAYFNSFGEFYIAKNIKENIDYITDEMTKVSFLVDQYELGYVNLRPGSKS